MQLDMEDGDQIDVHAEAIGGGDALAAAPHRRKAITASVKVGSNHLQPIANAGPRMTVTISTADPKGSTFVTAECPDQRLFHSIRVKNSSSVWSFLKTYAYCKARKFDPNFGTAEQYRLGIETLKCCRHYNSPTAADLTIRHSSVGKFFRFSEADTQAYFVKLRMRSGDTIDVYHQMLENDPDPDYSSDSDECSNEE